MPLTVSGGGSDLVFLHHEFSAGHTAALTGRPLANLYSHTGLVAYRSEKMSKSLDNLVLVSTLVGSGIDARAIPLAVLSQRYRDDWEWTERQPLGRRQMPGSRVGVGLAGFGAPAIRRRRWTAAPGAGLQAAHP